MDRVDAREKDGATTFDVRVTPGASADEIVGVEDGALKVRLRARAVEGKANSALLRFLAERLGVRQRQVVLVRGHGARRKVVAVAGVTPARVSDLVGGAP